MSIARQVLNRFEKEFGSGSVPRLFQAPGRVNLIGDHTDYNDGFVLPAAVDRHIVVAAAPRKDNRVNVYALDVKQRDRFDLNAIDKHPNNNWCNYIRGTAWSLQKDGHRFRGMDAVFAGDVPIGAGMSSSAALEISTGYAMLQLSGIKIDRLQLALAAQQAENEFVGIRCGIMDQFISCLGQKGHALMIDCRDLNHRRVPIPPDAVLTVVDSGVQRGLMDMEYNTRRAECETAAQHFHVKALRDVDEETFRKKANDLSPVVRRRARHVVTENARTLTGADTLEKGDLQRFGQLMIASHTSLRDDFEVSRSELDLLVDMAVNTKGVYGARLTGAGFGGCVIALATQDAVDTLSAAVFKKYAPATGREPSVYLCSASDGVAEIDL